MPWHNYQFFVACFQCLKLKFAARCFEFMLLMAHLFSAMRLRHLQYPRHCFYGSQSNSNEIKGADIFGLIESISSFKSARAPTLNAQCSDLFEPNFIATCLNTHSAVQQAALSHVTKLECCSQALTRFKPSMNPHLPASHSQQCFIFCDWSTCCNK